MKQGKFGHFHKFILTSSTLLLLAVLISQCITMQAVNNICSCNFMLYLLNAAYVSADWFLYDGNIGCEKAKNVQCHPMTCIKANLKQNEK